MRRHFQSGRGLIHVLPGLLAAAFARAAQPPTVPVLVPKPDAAAFVVAANAAPLYQQAFALLPQRPDDPDAKALKEAGDGTPDDVAAALVKKYDRAALLLRQGASVGRCDWGLDWTRGPELELPFLNGARTMSALIRLRCQVEAKAKRPAEVYEDVAALLVLGRRVGVEPFVLCKLIEAGVMQIGVSLAAGDLPGAPPDVLVKFDQRLANLPTSLPVGEAFRDEMISIVIWLRGLEKADPQTLFAPGGKLAVFFPTLRPDDPNLAMLKTGWADPAVRAAAIAEVQSLADAAAPIFTVPPAQVAQAAAAWEVKRNAVGFLAAAAVPSHPENFRQFADATDAQLAMLRSAIAVRQRGPTAVSASRDPAGNGPFQYRQTPGGFELESKLEFKGKPVTLTIGPTAP